VGLPCIARPHKNGRIALSSGAKAGRLRLQGRDGVADSSRPFVKRWTQHRMRALLRQRGPGSQVFRRRVAMVGGAISIGLIALGFAKLSDEAAGLFMQLYLRHPYLPLLLTPAGFAAIVWLTNRYAPDARGSGIPQVIAARAEPEGATRALIAMPVAIVKAVLTLLALLCGASVGREGPTVQLSAAVMALWHRTLSVQMRASMIIAGGAAGVAAAFNTPLAGIAFAIEELAAAYEQRMALLVMTAILISGAVASGLAGNYVYFGRIDISLGVGTALLISPVAGVLGGLAGGTFARLVLETARATAAPVRRLRRRPVVFALLCGAVVGAIGVATGLTWGTGYSPARAIVTGADAPFWFGVAKFAATLVTAVAGLPGGIFSPSLATGAGFGNMLRWLFPGEPASAIVLLGMVAYFTGVVRAPLTAVFILSETTANRSLMLPMIAAALVADQASQLVCREKLYNGLAKTFSTRGG
jgi:H+/Cl- antiporter ClcA